MVRKADKTYPRRKVSSIERMPIVYLDLDRTLFQTKRSGEVLLSHVGLLFPRFEVSRAIRERDSYYVEVGDLYYHDMSRQLRENGLDPQEVYDMLSQTEVADGRFEFEGCRELIESIGSRADVRVFTFGPDDYQRFKAKLCPSLTDLPVITTLQPKAKFLESNHDNAWLVDDRPIGDELGSNIQFVQVSLEGEPAPSDVAWPVFYSLDDLTSYFNLQF